MDDHPGSDAVNTLLASIGARCAGPAAALSRGWTLGWVPGSGPGWVPGFAIARGLGAQVEFESRTSKHLVISYCRALNQALAFTTSYKLQHPGGARRKSGAASCTLTRLSVSMCTCTALPCSMRRSRWSCTVVTAWHQGLTLVHFSAQRKHILWDTLDT
jgi:hypothetical protein